MTAVKTIAMVAAVASVPMVQSAVWYSQVTLNGAQEVPSNGSAGTGSATVYFNDSTKQITLDGTFSGLSGTANNAHVHGPAAAGSSAGAIFGLTFTAATSGTISGSSTYNSTRETDLFNGLHYINIHSTSFGGGEIRGQITGFTLVPEPAEFALMAGVGLIGFAIWRKRRGAEFAA